MPSSPREFVEATAGLTSPEVATTLAPARAANLFEDKEPNMQNTVLEQVRNIGSRLELFVDNWLLDRMDGVSLRMHHPVPREIALEFDRPWEGDASFDPVVMKDGDRYRLWYRGCWAGTAGSMPNSLVYPDQCTGYAESDDGIHWERPTLGITEFDGSKENNIVLRGGRDFGIRAVCVFKDGNPATPDSERYKAIGRAPSRSSIRGMVSPDGIHWEMLDKDPIITAPPDAGGFDTHNIAYWDPLEGHYVAYMRGLIPPAIRHIRRSTSEDFREWTRPEFIHPYPGFLDVGDGRPFDLASAPAEHLYKNACSQYYRAPHMYLMFPKRYNNRRKFHEERDLGLSEGVFMTSRDGKTWDRRFMEAFLRPGPDPDNWVDRNMYIGPGVVPTGPAEMSVYYIEHYHSTSVRLRRGALRIDGFVSVNAPFSGGELVTRPLTFEGRELVINYASSVAGYVRVEILDMDRRPIDGHKLDESVEIYGDEIERVVAWHGGSDVSTLAGKPVRLRVAMKDADLYSIQFR
jgi:hypothetical protein